MKNFANQNLDMTIGAGVAMLVSTLLRRNGVEIGADVEIALGMLFVAVMARLGIKLYGKTENKEADDA